MLLSIIFIVCGEPCRASLAEPERYDGWQGWPGHSHQQEGKKDQALGVVSDFFSEHFWFNTGGKIGGAEGREKSFYMVQMQLAYLILSHKTYLITLFMATALIGMYVQVILIVRKLTSPPLTMCIVVDKRWNRGLDSSRGPKFSCVEVKAARCNAIGPCGKWILS